MAGGHGPGRSVGGGGQIPAPGRSPGRLTRGVASAGAASALASWVVATTAHTPGPLAALGVIAVAFVGVAVARGRISNILVGVALLGVAYMLSRIGQGVDAGAALFGSGLLVVTELGSWSLELRSPLREAPGGHWQRWLLLGALVAGSTVLGLVVLVAGARSPRMGLSGEVMSAAAAVAAFALLGALAWRLRAWASIVSRGGDVRGLP